MIGAARTVVSAPKLAPALGYDVEQALE